MINTKMGAEINLIQQKQNLVYLIWEGRGTVHEASDYNSE